MLQWPVNQRFPASTPWQYVAQPASKGHYVGPSGTCQYMYLSPVARNFTSVLTVGVQNVIVGASCMDPSVRQPCFDSRAQLTETFIISPTFSAPTTMCDLFNRHVFERKEIPTEHENKVRNSWLKSECQPAAAAARVQSVPKH